jgi:protein O-mannosyl-transferase
MSLLRAILNAPKTSLDISLHKHPKKTFLLLSGVLVLFLYWRAFTSPFIYDDLDQVLNNPNLESWSLFVQRFFLRPVALTTSFLGYAGSIYRPLFWISLFIDRAMWGLHAGGFHATNVALHFVNGNLAFALLRRLKMPVLSAAVVALLWLSLPIDTEVVAWISSRSYALCSMFIMICLLSALKRIRAGGFMWGLACFAAAVCGVLSHELGIVILPLLFLVVLITNLQYSKNLLETLGIVCLAEISVEALRFAIGVKTFSSVASLKWASLALRQYVVLTLFPLHMSVERSTTISPSQPYRWLIVGMLCFALTLSYAVLRRRNNPALLGGLTWFAICIAPFCLLMNYQGVAERFTYLASIGIVTAVIAVCSIPSQPRLRNLLMMFIAVWGVWNIYRTTLRVADWADPVRLYQNSLQATPQSLSVRYNLAFSLRERGDLHGALTEYNRVLQVDKNYPHALASLGDVYLQLDLFQAAQAAYKQALIQDPKDIAALLNSGTAYQGAGALSEAETTYQRVLQLDPASSAAHVNLGVLYLKEKRSNDAVHQFASAIDLKTKDPIPYYDLAVLFQQAGRGDLALVLYKKVLELKPNDEDTLRNINILEQAH